MQPRHLSICETIAQNVVGQIVAFVILWLFGMTLGQSVALQIVFLATSLVRGYAIRRLFASIGSRRAAGGGCVT